MRYELVSFFIDEKFAAKVKAGDPDEKMLRKCYEKVLEALKQREGHRGA